MSPLLRRLAAGWLGVWFALLSVDPGWLHPCPMHGRGAVSAAESGTSAGHAHEAIRHAAHGNEQGLATHHGPSDLGASHASHASHAEHAGDSPTSPASPTNHSHDCACLGDCSSATGGLLSLLPVTVPQAEVVNEVAELIAPERQVVARRVTFVLPFATAPPAHLS